jgi:hypothetical protein
MRSGQRFSYLALDPEETRIAQRRLPRAHRDQSKMFERPGRSSGLSYQFAR